VIGEIISGEYRVDAELGHGGFGVVYRCTELNLNRQVALKLVIPEKASHEALQRFNREAQVLASINHPNVVHVHRFGTHDGRPFLVMEFIEGETLSDMVLRGNRPSVWGAVGIMRHVAAGMRVLHAAGVVHRDLSPKNIMVTTSGLVKILDFGLAKNLDVSSGMTREGQLMGTLAYVSPEHVRGIRLSYASDMFSFGTVFYELLSGRHPFVAADAASVLRNIMSLDPEPLERIVPDLPKGLSALLERCLDKEPAHRPQGFGEIELALRDIQGSNTEDIPVPRESTESLYVVPGSGESNPYLNRSLIRDPEMFFGRRQEVRRIYSRLNATPPGSVSVVGERKIGKSSLLNFIFQGENRIRFLEHPERMVMVMLDLQEGREMSLDSFVGSLLGMIRRGLRGRVEIADAGTSLEDVKNVVQKLDEAGIRIAIFLDEFDLVTTNPNFDLEFFSFLRFLANRYNVAYITSSSRDLQLLCHTKEIADSPFFNIFTRMRLSVFQPEEARDLIAVPSERLGRPLAAHTDRILALTGLFPFYIQIACTHLVEFFQENPDADQPEWDDIRKRFAEEVRPHFYYVWGSFDEHERAALGRLAHGKSLPDALRHVAEELEAKNYVVSEGGEPGLFSESFREFVRGVAPHAGPSRFLRWLKR